MKLYLKIMQKFQILSNLNVNRVASQQKRHMSPISLQWVKVEVDPVALLKPNDKAQMLCQNRILSEVFLENEERKFNN